VKLQLTSLGILFVLFVFCMHRAAQSTAPFHDPDVYIDNKDIREDPGYPTPLEALKRQQTTTPRPSPSVRRLSKGHGSQGDKAD
jgi:hypothetical protein